MANYTNLASLQGLAVGDIVTYNTTTTIDLKGYTVSGIFKGFGNGYYNGGTVTFTLNSSLLPATTVKFNRPSSKSRTDGIYICYGNTNLATKRIVVAGDAGDNGWNSVSAGSVRGGQGGGTTGTAGNDTSHSTYGGSGGEQLAGGAGGTWQNVGVGTHLTGSAGGFAYGGGSTSTEGNGGYGWFGGGQGASFYDGDGNYTAGGGGGSSFVVGQTTTNYPSDYFSGENSTLVALESAMTAGSTIPGSSSGNATNDLVLTIVALPPVYPAVIKRYNGSSFETCNIKYYNGSSFVVCAGKYYDGTNWIDLMSSQQSTLTPQFVNNGSSSDFDYDSEASLWKWNFYDSSYDTGNIEISYTLPISYSTDQYFYIPYQYSGSDGGSSTEYIKLSNNSVISHTTIGFDDPDFTTLVDFIDSTATDLPDYFIKFKVPASQSSIRLYVIWDNGRDDDVDLYAGALYTIS